MATIIYIRPTKVLDRSAPYWKGERAEAIVTARAVARAAEKATRQASRPARSSGMSSRTRTPNAQLRRLERALKRRKTLAAQERVKAQIKQLKRELGV
jgi:hypothetical protein